MSTELRKRSNLPSDINKNNECDENDLVINQDPSKELPQASDDVNKVIDDALRNLTPRWRNWIIRAIVGFIMILTFITIVYLGPFALVCLVFIIQIKCFHEIITIGHVVYKSHDLPWFRTLSWYFLIAANYFFYGESLIEYFGIFASKTEFTQTLASYHRFISFTLYMFGFVGFVLSLVKTYYLKQFTLFGWTHVTLLLLVTHAQFIIQNIFEGLIWFLVPVSMIICNDIMAYIFGFFFGKTPLIKLSPKKTWEGFIGGAFSTVIFGIMVSYFLLQYDYFVCPIEYNETNFTMNGYCDRLPVFQLTDYSLPKYIQFIFKLVGYDGLSIKIYPFMLHSVAFSIFASIIGPFGGFFASGFKRAFKIKDFGATFPGHGGIMDRFDCQFLMATFVHVYFSSFIKAIDVKKLLANILKLNTADQISLYNSLEKNLVRKGLIFN